MARYFETRVLKSEPAAVPLCWYMELEGVLDGGETLQAFESEAKQRIASGTRWLLLEVSRVTSYCDLGHGAVAVLQHALAQSGGGVVFIGMPKKPQVTWEILGLAPRFHFTSSRHAADRWVEKFGNAEGGVIDYSCAPNKAGLTQGKAWEVSPLALKSHAVPGRPDCLRVDMIGSLDATTVIWFDRWLRKWREAGYRHFFWNLIQTEYINETGLDSFIAAADAAQKENRCWAVCNLSGRLKPVFEMLSLDSYFKIYDTVETAISDWFRAKNTGNEPGETDSRSV